MSFSGYCFKLIILRFVIVYMIKLEENRGVPRVLLVMMAAMAGFTVANCYYNQPLLEMIRHELGVSEVAANLITVVTQVGYALGLCFIIPMGDLYSRRRIIAVSMGTAALMALLIAIAQSVWVVWVASVVMGACSVIPQVFMPIAGQYSRPADKSRNIGIVLSGLLTGILASRVLSGFVGDWLGWRAMFFIAAGLMVICLVVCLSLMPSLERNFSGTYVQLMRSVFQIFREHRGIRLNSIRAAFGFGSMMSIWSCLAFHLAQPPFNAGADMVGTLGACGIVGAVAASGMGKYVPRYGIRWFSVVGAVMQVAAWLVAWLFSNSYVGLIFGIIMVDVGLQCLQLSNQSGCIQAIPEASNRANTAFMTTYFIGGSAGTFCAGMGWDTVGWGGVCLVGMAFAVVSLAITLAFDRK